MTNKYISAKLASAIDAELMGPTVGFTIEQLMELAGLSVAQAIYKHWGPQPEKNQVIVIAGPGNNGGDGLVCARHLKLLGYKPIVYYPKRSSKVPFYGQLVQQLQYFKIPVLSMEDNWKCYLDENTTLCVVDAIFGFSFKPPSREPFSEILTELKKRDQAVPIVAVDIPSGWDVDNGPVHEKCIIPNLLVSLTAPKLCAQKTDPRLTTHYVGGRFVPESLARKYSLEEFLYPGIDHVLRL
ncbi:HBR286Cp [Eremothecium sinecaudum]|uniref:NAD(P)H-hydrate epimerase n=1 Tax=Eremothecium sinecaudum TaxID=45286 RepID=A0A120K1B0_9SACH|nr:HBR286Cp [Eremothecium sinecaudum]AMD19187.1 HBR286Cp [Eremothecium sinecaudum]